MKTCADSSAARKGPSQEKMSSQANASSEERWQDVSPIAVEWQRSAIVRKLSLSVADGLCPCVLANRQLRSEVSMCACLFLLGVLICRIPLTSPRLEHGRDIKRYQIVVSTSPSLWIHGTVSVNLQIMKIGADDH